MPSAPTRSDIETAWKAAIKLFDQTYRFGSVNAENFLALLDDLVQSGVGEYASEILGAAEALRSAMASTVSQQAAQSLFRPLLQTYVRHVINRANLSTDEEMLQEMYRYFVDNNLRVKGRNITYGTPSPAAWNVGTTQVLRLTSDRYNFPLESVSLDAKRLRCVLDSNTGTGIGGETWLLKGQVKPKDDLYRSGSGLQAILSGLTIDNSLLSNPGFRSLSGSATEPDDIPDWDSSVEVSSTYYEFDSTNYFRRAPSDGSVGTVYSLMVKGSAILSQKLSARGTVINQDVPYLLAVVWNRDIGSAAGTFVLRMGNVQQSIDVSDQSGWVVSTVPSTPSWGCWYRVFQEENLEITLEWDRTGGDLRIAEVLLVPGTYFDGTYYWILPSSTATYVPPRVDDEFTWTDYATDAIIQRSLAFAWPGFYLPSSIGSSITWEDP